MEERDSGRLVEVMGHLLAVKEHQSRTDAMFEPLQQTINLLKGYEQELPEVVHRQLEVRDPYPQCFCFSSCVCFTSTIHLLSIPAGASRKVEQCEEADTAGQTAGGTAAGHGGGLPAP